MGKALVLGDYPIFLSSTLLSSFVAPITGLPFSLELLKIPKETFQLFVVSTVLTDRIRVVLGAFHLIALTLLTVSAMGGYLRFKKRKFSRSVVILLIATVLSVLGLRQLLSQSMKRIPSNLEIAESFTIISPQRDFVILETSKRNPNPTWCGENTLSRIKRRSKIRVGFYTKSGPFTYFNKDSVLVGYGIDLAHQLATDLEVDLEFVPVPPGDLIEQLNTDHFDIFVSDVFLSGQYAEKIQLSKPYLNVSLALLTHQQNKIFDNYKNTAALDTFTISFLERKEIAGDFLSYFPKGGAYPLHEIPEFFEIEKNGRVVIDSIAPDSIHVDTIRIQAHLTSAERASYLTIKHPEYKVRNPLPYHVNNSLVFPLARDDAWRISVNRWIEFRQQDGTFDKIYDQGILGNPHQAEKKPWSIYQDIVKPRFEKHEGGEEDDQGKEVDG